MCTQKIRSIFLRIFSFNGQGHTISDASINKPIGDLFFLGSIHTYKVTKCHCFLEGQGFSGMWGF